MLKELEKTKTYFSVGNAELYLRYDMFALLAIEKDGADPFDLSDITAKKAKRFLRHGLRSYFDQWEYEGDAKDNLVDKLMQASDPEELCGAIRRGILEALPEPVIGAAHKNNGAPDMAKVRTLFCDVMGREERDFWSSTLREIMSRWDGYAEFMGYKKPPVQVRKYDDD